MGRQEAIDDLLECLARSDVPSLMGSCARRVRLLARQLAVASDLAHGDARVLAFTEAHDEAHRIHADLVERRRAAERQARSRGHDADRSYAAHLDACRHSRSAVRAISREWARESGAGTRIRAGYALRALLDRMKP